MRTPVAAGRGLVELAACMLGWCLSTTLFGKGHVMRKVCSLQSKPSTIGHLVVQLYLNRLLVIWVAGCRHRQLDGFTST
jgi:hypothetical protein